MNMAQATPLVPTLPWLVLRNVPPIIRCLTEVGNLVAQELFAVSHVTLSLLYILSQHVTLAFLIMQTLVAATELNGYSLTLLA